MFAISVPGTIEFIGIFQICRKLSVECTNDPGEEGMGSREGGALAMLK